MKEGQKTASSKARPLKLMMMMMVMVMVIVGAVVVQPGLHFRHDVAPQMRRSRWMGLDRVRGRRLGTFRWPHLSQRLKAVQSARAALPLVLTSHGTAVCTGHAVSEAAWALMNNRAIMPCSLCGASITDLQHALFIYPLFNLGLPKDPKELNIRKKGAFILNLPLVSREWKNGSNSSYNCTPFLHSLPKVR